MTSIDAAVYLAIGAGLGALYFFLLFQTVRLQAARLSAIRIVPLHVLRVAVAVAAFWGLAQAGPMPLLLALSGFLIARLGIQRWIGAN